MFQPRYISADELPAFGLPDEAEQANIMSMVDGASTLVDEYCGRVDGDGAGSLVYSTYIERLTMPKNRNIARTTYKPLVALDATLKGILAASGVNYYTGFQENTINRQGTTTLHPLISASGRYGYGRRSDMAGFPDINMLNMAMAVFGGPPQFSPIDVAGVDFEPKTGELWFPSSLMYQQFTEVVVIYNAGFNPRNMPRAVKEATAAIVKNAMVRGAGTTGVKGYTMKSGSVTFTDSLIDPTVEQYLDKYKVVVAM